MAETKKAYIFCHFQIRPTEQEKLFDPTAILLPPRRWTYRFVNTFHHKVFASSLTCNYFVTNPDSSL
jgi:hypothetical protein